MTDQEHADAIRAAILALSEAVEAAREAGLSVCLNVDHASNTNRTLINWLCLNEVSRHF